MSFDPDQLYKLLPAIHRIRDAERGDSPLRELLAVIADQVAVLEEDLAQLYDDQFIETCADWVAPYIGDLIGYRPLYGVVPKVASPRAEVAHTIAFRRRKGTATMLEQLANDVTGWPARVVEYFQLLATTQFMNHVRPDNHYAPDLRKWEPLERLGTAFESTAHTIDVRRIATQHGRYNIPNIGIFLWRLRALRLTESPAVPAAAGDQKRFLFSPLGIDAPLFTFTQPEEEITHLAEPRNVPEAISRRVLAEALAHDAEPNAVATYYGADLSILLAGVAATAVEACNLSDLSDGSGNWAHEPATHIAIDPVLGRIAFPTAQASPPQVTFHHGFSAEMGGGEYPRAATFDHELAVVQTVPVSGNIQTALSLAAGGGVVEIHGSGRHEETLRIKVNTGQRLEVRAIDFHRPTIVLGGDLEIAGDAEAEVTLNGLLVAGGVLRVSASAGNALRKLRLRHCTLVPGLSLQRDATPVSATAPGIVIELPNLELEIEDCIVGSLQVIEQAKVSIRRSIVDAANAGGIAYSAPPAPGATPTGGGTLRIDASTLIGQVHTFSLEYASNSIFHATAPGTDAPIRSDKRQAGCVRFCFVPPGSVVPSRYRCQPDLALAERAAELGFTSTDKLPESEKTAVRARLLPAFNALRYGRPAYGQLADRCPAQIRQGADDESEMGAFHDLYQPQRETNLRVRLDEYLRFGLEAGIFHAT